MRVHEFVDGDKPIMVFIHGVLCPWKVWNIQIEAFRNDYNIYAFALNAHTEDVASEFTTLDNQVEEIIHQSQTRDPKVLESFKKNFLPEKYLSDYLKIADFMTDESMKNIVLAAFSGSLLDNVENHSRILFIHGTRGNEILSKKAARLMKKYYPETQVVCFKGDAHCHKAIYEPEKWIDTVRDFLT